jgi:hypothetical protein
MASARLKDIAENLDFAMASNREVIGLVAEAQRTDSTVSHISQKAGVTLAAIRECYDYCAADLRDDFLTNKKRIAYYPFHPDSLVVGKTFHELEQTNGSLFGVLQRIAIAMGTNQIIDGTMCLYRDARAVNDLVNSKKHDRVIAVSPKPNARTMVEFKGGTAFTSIAIYPMDEHGVPIYASPGPAGAEAWVAGTEASVSAVKEFFFDAPDVPMTRRDVGGFCMSVITGARFILSDVYSVAYGLSHDVFK